MDFYSLVIIAIALSLDAFGVAISIGINKGVKRNSKLIFAASFGFFQFFFTLLGAYAGFLFNTYVVAIPKIIGGVIIALVGVLMIKEGFEEKEDNIFSSFKMYIILGISVSIDAAVVGFTVFNKINSNYIIAAQSIFVGIVTFIISVAAFIISKYLRKLDVVTKYADYVGGVILILFGLKMMFF